jgi:hypothetical protein
MEPMAFGGCSKFPHLDEEGDELGQEVEVY